MKKLLLGSAVLAVLATAGTAMAADMPVKVGYKAPPPVALGWTGFYLGGSVGVRAAEVDATATNFLINGAPAGTFTPGVCNNVVLQGCVFTQPMNSIAARGSLHGGYNLQVLPNALLGVEADWGWGNRTTTLNGANYPFRPIGIGIPSGFGMTGNGGDSFAVGTRWDASLRGRVGWLPNPSMLLYATGGAAWLNIRSSSTCNASILSACGGFNLLPTTVEQATTRTGWTAGGGLEAMLAPNWIARAEYRYADFGTASFSDTRTGTLFGIVSTVVVSYDLRVRTHTALFGVSYLFGGPVVANY